jgi:hypothetical protein
VAQATKKYRDEVTPYKLLISSFTINNFRVCVSHQKRGVPTSRDRLSMEGTVTCNQKGWTPL